MAGRSIVSCLNLSGFRIYEPEKDPKPVNYQQAGDDNTLETGPTFKNPCYKKARDYSISEKQRRDTYQSWVTMFSLRAASPAFAPSSAVHMTPLSNRI